MRQSWLVGSVTALALVAAVATAQTATRVRGTIVAIDGKTMMVKSRDGRDLRIELSDTLTVAVARAARFEDIKEGDYVGATTTKQPDGPECGAGVFPMHPCEIQARRADRL